MAAGDAQVLLCASFVVADATVRYLRTVGPATFVVTGDKGGAREDRACADYIAELVDDRDADPAPYLHDAAESMAAADLARAVELGYRGVHRDDVARCLQVNEFPFAMLASREEHGLVLRACPAGTAELPVG